MKSFALKNFLILCAAILIITVGVLAYLKQGQPESAALASSNLAASDNTPKSTDTEAKQSEAATAESEIRGILQRYYEIARTNDRAALKNYSREISAPEYEYTSELGVMDKEETFRHLDSLKFEFVTTEFDGLTVQVHGETAIAKYRDLSEIRAGRETRKKQMRFTNVWVRRDGGRWQIVAEHSSVLLPAKLLPRHPLADKMARK